jgi:ribosomal protein L40E
MEPADSIKRLGFKRWYERQLIDSHLALVTALLCAVLAAVSIEDLHIFEAGPKPVRLLVIVFVALAITILGVRRFISVLFRAEHYGNKSVCTQCKAYARFDIVGVDERTVDEPVLAVRCRKCAAEWQIP